MRCPAPLRAACRRDTLQQALAAGVALLWLCPLRSLPSFCAVVKAAITLAFAPLATIGAMAMGMGELFSWVERRTTGWAHRGSQAA